jgi:hydrogenase nickel incorporation protein HypA/HybF
MHELAITQEVVEIVTDRCQGARVARVVLEIGRLTAILPDAVRFCFDVCAAGTVVEGAALDIIETPGSGRCTACGAIVPMEQAFARCACGCSDLEWLTGEELRVREVEVV